MRLSPLIKLYLTLASSIVIAAVLSVILIKYTTEPRTGITMTRMRPCDDEHYYIIKREGNMVTWRNEETKEIKTTTVKEFKKQ
jgi:hypothetical protein